MLLDDAWSYVSMSRKESQRKLRKRKKKKKREKRETKQTPVVEKKKHKKNICIIKTNTFNKNMSDTKDTSTANHIETPNDNGVEKELTDIDEKPMDPSNNRSNNSNSNSKDDVNAEVAAVIATNAAAANGKKRPLVDVTSTSPNKSVDAKDVKENINHREDPQDENDHKEKEKEEEKVTKDTTKEPRSKKARTEEPSTATTTTTPQDSNQSSIAEKTKPIFGSATASAFAAYAVPKQPEQKENAQPEQGDDKLIDSIKDSDTNHANTKSLNQGGFFGFSTATGTATSAFSLVGNSSSVFGKGSSCTSLGFGMGGNPPTTGSSSGSSSSNFLSLSSSAFGGTCSTFGATALSCAAENNQDAESSPVPPTMASLSQPIVPLPVLKEPVSNGEENEEAILTLRAKLFKLAKVKQVVGNSKNVEDLAASSSSTGGRDTKKKSVGIEMATKVGQQPENNADTAKESTLESNAVKMDWKEVGIGPLRVLTSSDKHARIVQRRENTPGGQGTKLILNVALRKECKVERKGDKFVRFAAFEVVEEETKSDKQEEKKETEDPSNHSRENVDNDTQQNSKGATGKDSSVHFELVQYLFKVKTIGEADMLLETLGKYCSKMTAS